MTAARCATLLLLCLCAGSGCETSAAAGAVVFDITIDVRASRRPINPLIYGTANATPEQLRALNASWHRLGGNPTSRYNWRENASNRGADWFFESVPDAGVAPGQYVQSVVDATRGAGAVPAVTVPMGDWVARLGPGRSRLASFSVRKYGPQAQVDAQWFPDAGNGVTREGARVTGNDPADANVRVTPDFHVPWVQRLAPTVQYYIVDNEPSLWFETHRDVHPGGLGMDETNRRILETSAMIRAADGDARVMAPEEWGWLGFHYSGADQQFAQANGWWRRLPDRAAHGGADYLPWMLEQWRAEAQRTGRLPVDVVTVHYYPQGGEFSRDVSPAMQQRRARSTRALWDPAYVDESWINTPVALIPRLRAWVDAHYVPGVPIALTEYHWGADDHMSGALAQADLLGIFGREGLDMAARWDTPPVASPVFQVMKLFRNYDDRASGFGELSVRATTPDADQVAAYAAERRVDGALTIVLVNKRATAADVRLGVLGRRASMAERYEVAAGLPIRTRASESVGGGRVLSLPSQSVTLLVVR